MAYTHPIIGKQWNNIERELIGTLNQVCQDSLYEEGEKILRKIKKDSTYMSETGNLDDSLMFAVYHKGVFKQLSVRSKYTGKVKPMYGTYSEFHGGKSSPYNVRSNYLVDTSINHPNSSAGILSGTKGDVLYGRIESMKALNEYNGEYEGKYPRRMELAVVAQMYYRYFIEEKYMRSFIELEQTEQLYADDLARNIKSKAKAARWGKNIRYE